MPTPLKPEEIPEEHRDSFLYDKQELGSSGNRQVLKIERQCSTCPKTYQVTVFNVRGDLSRGRQMRPGKCKDCKGRVITKEGYVHILARNHPAAYRGLYVPEHILVMEDALGRYLDRQAESVHHINGDRSDNRLENLQLRNKYHGKGQALECLDCGSHNVQAVALKD